MTKSSATKRVGLFVAFVILTAVHAAPAYSADVLLPPNSGHWLGTGRIGEDILRWTFAGAGYSLFQVLLGMAGALCIGITLAIVSSLRYQKGPDVAVIGLAETIRTFPGLLLVLLLGSMGFNTVGALIAVYWMMPWRVLRVQLYQERRRGYFLSAISLGRSPSGAMFVHALPNVLLRNRSLLLTMIADMLAAESALEFLGLGPPLDQPSLGRQVFWALDFSFDYAWTWVPAVVLIVSFVGVFQWLSSRLSKNENELGRNK